jgi:hypothetical protein
LGFFSLRFLEKGRGGVNSEEEEEKESERLMREVVLGRKKTSLNYFLRFV